jgi:5-hydroxyisourate hydrolase-like protein (transthyretin family)
MKIINTITTTLFSAMLLFTVTGCNLGSDTDQEIATAIISAEFIDAESGEAISEVSVLVAALFEGAEEPADQGTVDTDEEGKFEVTISNLQELTITMLQFTFEYEDETVVIEEEVELNLTFEEPFDKVELSFEVTLEDNGDDDNGDENGNDD